MENNVIINAYYEMFGELPPIIATISVKDEKYLRLIAYALAEGKKIDEEMFNDVFAGVEYDIVDSFDIDEEDDFNV